MKKIFLIILILFVQLIFSGCSGSKYAQIADSCKANKGSWSEKYHECTNVSKEICNKLGGGYDDCASACRHDSLAQACIEMCIHICEFN